MFPAQNSKSFGHFAKHLFIAGKIYIERNKAKEDVNSHLQRMRKSVIRMTLGYSDIDKLKEKVNNLIYWERNYAKLFKLEDRETKELREHINVLAAELRGEREDKQRIAEENNQKISQLTGSLNNIQNQMRHLHLEKAKRQQRLNALEEKIKKKVDVHHYYHS